MWDWNNTMLLAPAQAGSISISCFLPLSHVPREASPSPATTAPAVSWALKRSQTTKFRFNFSGSRAVNTWLKVSCQGTPLGSFRNVFSQSRFDSREPLMPFQLLVPVRTAAMAIKKKCFKWMFPALFYASNWSGSKKYCNGVSIFL